MQATRDRACAVGILATAILVVAQVTAQLTDYAAFHSRIVALDSNSHTSVFGIASLAAQALAAIVAWRYARRSPRRSLWVFVGSTIAILLVLRVSATFSSLLVVPTAALFVIWWMGAEDLGSRGHLLRVALLLLVFSFLVHVVGPKIISAIGADSTSWAYEVKGILKHTTELAGWSLATLAVATATPTRRLGPVGVAPDVRSR